MSDYKVTHSIKQTNKNYNFQKSINLGNVSDDVLEN